MNRVTLCSNCREKSREIIAYGQKLAAAEARLRESEEALRVACDYLSEASAALWDASQGGTLRAARLAYEIADTRIAEIAKLRGAAGKGGGE